MNQRQEKKRNSGLSTTRQRLRRALIVSVLFHVGLLIVLLIRYFPNRETAADVPATRSHKAVAELPPPPPLPTARGANVPAEQIKASLMAQTEAATKASDEQKLKELDRNLQQLDRVSDIESVDDVAKAIAESMGIDRAQYADKPKPKDGAFDFDTAQLKNVVRTQDESGKWSYSALMVDTEGREMSVPIGEAEGKPAYEMFEKLNQYPLAESLYRQLVMPMIQQVMEAKKSATAIDQ